MKQLEVQVRSHFADEVVEIGNRHGGFAPSHHPVSVEGEDGWSLVQVNLPNDRIGPFVGAVQDAVDEAEFVIPAAETLPVRTPVSDIRDRVADVTRRSTLELVLDVLQSVGTWQGMLLYAAISGLIAAYGVIFDVAFLLTAAMLIAPFGAPAMVCVVAISIGDGWMFRRGAVRFGVSLAVLAAAGAGLGLAYGLEGSTSMMELLTNLSGWSALLGVAGGAAGAQALVQAERDSMVTATATGFLVAVSLAPPAAVLGLSAAIGRWDYVALMTFLVLLTAAGVLLGGWAALRLRGVRPGEFTGGHGGQGRRRWMVGLAGLALVASVVWQTEKGTRWRKADATRQAARIAQEAVEAVPAFHVLRSRAYVTPGEDPWTSGEGMVVSVEVTGASPEAPPGAAALDSLRAEIGRRLSGEMEDVRFFVDLRVVPGS